MECKHGLDTRWCAVCIHGPLPTRPSRPLPPPAGGRPHRSGTVATGHGLRDFERDGAGRVRYLCACGAVGAWVLAGAEARLGHADHSRDAHASTKSRGFQGQA